MKLLTALLLAIAFTTGASDPYVGNIEATEPAGISITG